LIILFSLAVVVAVAVNKRRAIVRVVAVVLVVCEVRSRQQAVVAM